MRTAWPSSLVLMGALSSSAVFGEQVTVKGSDTMVILNQRWAQEFMKQNPSTRVQVTGGGTGTGIASLINGMTDIAAASRPMKPAEIAKLKSQHGSEPTQTAVAKDGVTFYVNERNPVGALTEEQLRGIYMGDITNWKEVGGEDAPIIIYSRENSSGTYVFVKDELLKGEDFAPTAQTLPGTAAVVNAVGREKNGIGYGGAGFSKRIKLLPIRVGELIVEATLENIKSGKYPLARDLYFYTRQKPAGELQKLIEFCLSAEGQRLVSKVGYFPVK